MSRKKNSKAWLQKQNNDPYVKRVRETHYRSRAVYKLQEIDEKDQLIKPNYNVVDLGSAPGSWTQYVVEKVGYRGSVMAVDILPMIPIQGVVFIQGDFTEEKVEKACLEQSGKQKIDLVISDMAPNLSGVRVSDQARSMAIAELVHDFSLHVLKPGGDLLVKLFEGAGTNEYRQLLKQHFAKVMSRKPQASRNKSREFYILARSYKL